MRKIIIEVETDSDEELITYDRLNPFNDIVCDLKNGLSKCRNKFHVSFVKEEYIPKHAEKPGFMGRDAEQEELEKTRSQQIPFGAAA